MKRKRRTEILAELITQYVAEMRDVSLLPAMQRPLSKTSQKSYQNKLSNLSRALGPTATVSDFTKANLAAYMQQLETYQRPRTRKAAITAWRAFGRWLVSSGYIKTNPASSIPVPRLDVAHRARCSDALVSAMIEGAARLGHPRRAALATAIMHVLAFTGVRRAELLALTLADVNTKDGILHVNLGKGMKSRAIPLSVPVVGALRVWITQRGECRHNRLWDYDGHRHIGDVGLRTLLREVAAAADERDEPGAKPHAIRHNFATRILQNGGDIKSIQELLGHSSLATTMVYLHTDDEQLRHAVDLAQLAPAQPQPQPQPQTQTQTPKSNNEWRRASWRRER